MKFNMRHVYISPSAKIGNHVKIGDNTTIYDNVTVSDNTIIANDCVIGEPLNAYYQDATYQNPPTVIGAHALIRSHTIIYAGSNLGDGTSTGHRVTMREYAKIGKNCKIGTGCDLHPDVTMGNYCWLNSNVLLCQYTKLGNFVFIYPNVVFTNDDHPPSNELDGPEVDDYTQISTASVILPGIKIGKHALVGAGSIVTRNVGDHQMVNGNPARFIRDIREIISKKTGQPYYPWPTRFSRGMPWEGMKYADWLRENETK
jgi:acetyltransferase-like isoleucine patch superfamily enzyme